MSRFSRQEKVLGAEAQKKIENSTVTIIGVGALGTVAASLLARAGIKKLVLIDRDVVEESNLPQQLLFTEKDLGRSKAICAKEKLQQISSRLEIIAQVMHLSSRNIAYLNSGKNSGKTILMSSKADLIIDCTDNLKTRFLINDYCKKEKIPLVFGSAIKKQGQAMIIYPAGPCLGCFLKETSLETCEQVGVLNTLTSIIGSLQADLAVKALIGKELSPELHHFDLELNSYRKIKINKNQHCRPCKGIYDYLNKKEDAFYLKFCSSGKYQIEGKKIDLAKLKEKLASLEQAELEQAEVDTAKLRLDGAELKLDGNETELKLDGNETELKLDGNGTELKLDGNETELKLDGNGTELKLDGNGTELKPDGPVKPNETRLKQGRTTKTNGSALKFDGTALQFKNILLFADGRALIKAGSEEEAQAIYSKYVGN